MTYEELNDLILIDDYKLTKPISFLIEQGFNHFDPLDFEKFVLLIFQELGFDCNLTPKTNDEGIDILLNTEKGKVVIQCKNYSENSIGSREIREFLGSMLHSNAIHGYFITTSVFSDIAVDFAFHHRNITLIDKSKLKKLFILTLSDYDKFGSILDLNLTRNIETTDLDDNLVKSIKALNEEYEKELIKIKKEYETKKMKI